MFWEFVRFYGHFRVSDVSRETIFSVHFSVGHEEGNTEMYVVFCRREGGEELLAEKLTN